MQISAQVIQVLDYICKKIGVVVDWTNSNVVSNMIPYIKDLMHRVVQYEIATSAMYIAIAIIVFIIVYKLLVKKYIPKLRAEDDCDNDGFVFFLYVIFGLVTAISFVIIVIQTYDIITAIYLPEKIYLNLYKTYFPK